MFTIQKQIYRKNSGWLYSRLRNERVRNNKDSVPNENSSDVNAVKEITTTGKDDPLVNKDFKTHSNSEMDYQEEEYLHRSDESEFEYSFSGSNSSVIVLDDGH